MNGIDVGKRVVILQQESFYKDLDENGTCLAKSSLYNFDHPGAYCAEIEFVEIETRPLFHTNI